MNKIKFTKSASTILIICFLLFLYIASAATFLREKQIYSYYENRNLAVMPVISADGMLDGSYFSGIDTYLTEHAAGRNTILKANTYIDLYMLRRPVVNQNVIGDGVLLPWLDYEPSLTTEASEINADAIAARLKTRSDLVSSYGGKYYYVAVPCQYVCYEDKYPSYLNNRKDYTATAAKALFENFDEYGVDYIDMLSYYGDEGLPDYFSSTVDNHYGILGAYDTYTAIMNRILKDTDIKPDVLKREDFTLTELPNRYLGSRVRKLFGIWKSDEKLSVIIPKKSVSFARYNSGIPTEANVYVMPNTIWDDALYGLYMGGDMSSTLIDTMRPELPSVLIYGDSFTNAVECIAWYSFDKMYSLDYRDYSEKTLEGFIDENKPEIVICIRDYEQLLSSDGNGR